MKGAPVVGVVWLYLVKGELACSILGSGRFG